MALDYDLILKGGEAVDPSQGVRGMKDVAFKDGRVAALEDQIAPERRPKSSTCQGSWSSPDS